MTWRITFEGLTLDSDDFTIEELGAAEKIADTPWSILNPLRNVLAAKAFLSITLLRRGLADTEVQARLNSLSLKELKNAFEWVPETEDSETPEGEEQLELPLDLTTPVSSPSVRKGSAGARTKRGNAA